MSLRLLGCSLLVVLVAAFTLPVMAPTQQSNNPAPMVRWEYKVVSLETCSSDGGVLAVLNSLGSQGWELVSYEHAVPAVPRDAEGTLLIAPAATGPSGDVNPPTADSFQGRLSIRMGEVTPTGCRILLKRQLQPPTRQ